MYVFQYILCFWSANIIRTIERKYLQVCCDVQATSATLLVVICWCWQLGSHFSICVGVEPRPRLGWNAVILSTEDLALDLYLSSLLPEPEP